MEGETKRRRRSVQLAAEGLHRTHSNSTIAKTLQLPCDLSYTHSAWKKVRHRLGSFPQPVARRGEAAEEERAWMSLLFSCSYKWGKSLPYKEVQLPLN